jgi:hypothetical protein
MSSQGWVQLVSWASADGSAVTTNGADSSILPPPALYTLPAGILQIGTTIRQTAYGRMTSNSTASVTFTFKTFFGAVAVFTAQALTQIVSLTNETFKLEITNTIRAVGSGTNANALGAGVFLGGILGAAGAFAGAILPATAPAVGTGFDSTSSQQVDLRVNYSATGQSLTCHLYTLEMMN